MKTFKSYRTREEWLEAREDTAGASTIGRWVGFHDLTPPPDIPQVNDAMMYGSLWEPYIAQQFAFQHGLSTTAVNTPPSDLKPGELSWHDNSIMLDKETGYHVSFDAMYRKPVSGKLVTVEIKTGSSPRFTFLNSETRLAYKTQANVERVMAEADECVIVYSQRPENWKSMTGEEVERWVRKHLDVTDVTDTTIDLNSVKRWVDEIQDHNAPRFEDNAPTQFTKSEILLARYLDAKEKYKTASQMLTDYLKDNPEEIHLHGHVAKLRHSERRSTDWSKLVKDHQEVAKLSEDYTKMIETVTLSVTKEKKGN